MASEAGSETGEGTGEAAGEGTGEGTEPETEKLVFRVTFTNIYEAEGRYVPGGKKILNGRTLQAGEFSFTLTAVDAKGQALTNEEAYTQVSTNAADGTISFNAFDYQLSDMDQEDGHAIDTKKYYLVTEVIPDKSEQEKDMTYSTETYLITVTLHDNGEGEIIAKPDKAIKDVVFTNIYKPELYEYKFSFTKKWAGGHEDSIDWAFYSADGKIIPKKFNKKVISADEWYYEAWFPSDQEYYLPEVVPGGYQVRYENVGKNAGLTDRCYNGGTIINYKVPPTGDGENPILWIGCILAGIAVLGGLFIVAKRKKNN